MPSGKRLVIEHVSATANVLQGNRAQMRLFGSISGPLGIYSTFLGTELLSEGNGNAQFVVSQPVIAYLEGTNNLVSLQSWSGGVQVFTGNVGFLVTITGYLVDVGQ